MHQLAALPGAIADGSPPVHLDQTPGDIVVLSAADMELAALAQEYGVGDRVELVEWQPLKAIPNAIRECDIGLVPHRKHAHTDATIPHKLFQYMLASRPVIVSNCRPLARIIEETGAGLVFERFVAQHFGNLCLKSP